MNDKKETKLKPFMTRVSHEEVKLYKENCELKEEINQTKNKIKKIREASGFITGTATSIVKDNR